MAELNITAAPGTPAPAAPPPPPSPYDRPVQPGRTPEPLSTPKWFPPGTVKERPGYTRQDN